MSYSGEAAEQVVRITLNGVELAAKITGIGAKHLAVMLYAVLKDQKKTKGKVRLASMLRSGKELKVFAVRTDELQRFCQEAKKYGVLYCVLRDKNADDGLTDIMVRAEDAAKINRIFERFKLATVDVAAVRSNASISKTDKETAVVHRDKGDLFLDELMKPAPTKEEAQDKNPTIQNAPRSHRSEPILEPKENAKEPTMGKSIHQGSVRQELKNIREARSRAGAKRAERAQDNSLQPLSTVINTAVKKKGELNHEPVR